MLRRRNISQGLLSLFMTWAVLTTAGVPSSSPPPPASNYWTDESVRSQVTQSPAPHWERTETGLFQLLFLLLCKQSQALGVIYHNLTLSLCLCFILIQTSWNIKSSLSWSREFNAIELQMEISLFLFLTDNIFLEISSGQYHFQSIESISWFNGSEDSIRRPFQQWHCPHHQCPGWMVTQMPSLIFMKKRFTMNVLLLSLASSV